MPTLRKKPKTSSSHVPLFAAGRGEWDDKSRENSCPSVSGARFKSPCRNIAELRNFFKPEGYPFPQRVLSRSLSSESPYGNRLGDGSQVGSHLFALDRDFCGRITGHHRWTDDPLPTRRETLRGFVQRCFRGAHAWLASFGGVPGKCSGSVRVGTDRLKSTIQTDDLTRRISCEFRQDT